MYEPAFELVSQSWYTSTNNLLSSTDTFQGATSYYCILIMKPVNGFEVDSTTTVTVKDANGNIIEHTDPNLRSDGTVSVMTEDFVVNATLGQIRIDTFLFPIVGMTASSCYPYAHSYDSFEFSDRAWFCISGGSSSRMADTDLFEADKTYYFAYTIKPKTGYAMDSDTVLEIAYEWSYMRVSSNYVYMSMIGGITGSTGNMVPKDRRVHEVEIKGYEQPVVGCYAGKPAETLVLPEDASYEIRDAYWLDESYTILGEFERFHEGKAYTLFIRVAAKEDAFLWYPDLWIFTQLFDNWDNNVPIMREGGGIHALGYYPGTVDLAIFTEFAYPVQLIDEVEFEIDEPVAGAYPDYGPTYPPFVHYHSAQDLDAEDPEYYKNDINWDYMTVGEHFSSSDRHDLYMEITADPGYVFDMYPELLWIMVNGYRLTRYPYQSAEVIAPNKLAIYVSFAPKEFEYRVMFTTDGYCSTPATQFVKNGQLATEPEPPTAPGLGFRGWYTDMECTELYDFSAPVTEDLILHAKWEPVTTHTVNLISEFDYYDPRFIEDGKLLPKPEDPEKTGWIFGGWYKDPELQNLYDFSKPVTQDLTLYAKWTMNMPFVDVPEGAFYFTPVHWAYYHVPQITTGTSATTFAPMNKCTRAEIVTFLWRAVGMPEPTITENPFKDVPEGSFYYKAVLWTVENDITKGTSATTFAPMNKCTRCEVVTFLWRAKGKPEPTLAKNPFKDVPEGSFYYKAVLWAVENNITKGTSATTFAPKNQCTRGEIVTFLYRAYS